MPGNNPIPGSNKSLHQLTTEELGKLFPIVLSEPSKKWPQLFQEEKNTIMDAFNQSEILAIDHIGSTAVSGIKAKPCIDILLQVNEETDNQKLMDVFYKLGYQLNKHPENPPPHMTFVKGYTIRGIEGQTFHVHVRYPGDWDEIRFRDYLNQHKKLAEEYESLKTALASQYKYNREAYTQSKTAFIEKINNITRKQTGNPQ